MTAPVQDVLDGGPPEEGARPPRALVAAISVAAVLAAAVVALVAQRDVEPEVPVPVEVVGSLFFDDVASRRVELPSGGVEERDGLAVGTVRLELPDRELQGSARFAYDASLSGVGGKGYALHAWGDAVLDLGATSCQGTFGWSNLEAPLEGGGALQLRCDDGATIGGRLAATPQPGDDTAIDLVDGWYRAGAAPEPD